MYHTATRGETRSGSGSSSPMHVGVCVSGWKLMGGYESTSWVRKIGGKEVIKEGLGLYTRTSE